MLNLLKFQKEGIILAMSKARILVVEDESIVAMDIRNMLEKLGYTVVNTVSSGEVAIQETAEKQPDLVLMDIMLKGNMDGVQTADKIRNLFHIPVIYLTAYAEENTLQRAKVTEPYGYIIKPFQERELSTTIEIALYKHKSERKLEESEKWLSTTLRSIGDAVIATDPKGRVSFMNPVAEHLTGWQEAEAIGKEINSIFYIIDEKDNKPLDNYIIDVIQSGSVIRMLNSTILVSKDGKKHPIEHSGSLIKDQDGNLSGIVFVFKDITERRRAEAALRRSELQYRTTIDSLNDYIHVVDPDLRVVLLNNAFKKWNEKLGLAKDIIGRNLFEVFPFLEESVRNEYKQVFKTGETLVTEEANNIRDDIEIITETRKIPVFEGEKVVRIISVIRDITEKRKMETEMLKIQRLESLALMAGGIGHDFNNILTAIMANISLAMMYSDQDKIHEKLMGAERAALQAKNLTQQLLTFAKGGMPVKKESSIAELLKDSTIFSLRGSDVKYEFHISDDLWTMDIDCGQISQVINNLVINADQAMPQGGVIKISAENVVLNSEHRLPLDDGPYVKIFFEDQGVGIPEENLTRIFEPYFTTKKKGNGLGLATSHTIIKNHGGYITVKSKVGVGTTFCIYLPALVESLVKDVKEEEDEEESEEKNEEVNIMGNGKILVVDDDQFIRELAANILTNFGYEVNTVSDNLKAIDLYKESKEIGEPYDLVIMDYIIPGSISGLDAIKKLKEADEDVNAIISSGYSNDSVMTNFNYSFK